MKHLKAFKTELTAYCAATGIMIGFMFVSDKLSQSNDFTTALAVGGLAGLAAGTLVGYALCRILER